MIHLSRVRLVEAYGLGFDFMKKINYLFKYLYQVYTCDWVTLFEYVVPWKNPCW